MIWVALYVNCFTGGFRVVGPFSSKEDAQAYGEKQKDPRGWEAMQMENAE